MNEFELILAIMRSIDERLLAIESHARICYLMDSPADKTRELIDRLSNVIPKGDPR